MEAAVGAPDGGDQGGVGPLEDATPMDAYLRKLGLYRKLVAKDGSCLFRAVAEQVRGRGPGPGRGGRGPGASRPPQLSGRPRRGRAGPAGVTAAHCNVGTGRGGGRPGRAGGRAGGLLAAAGLPGSRRHALLPELCSARTGAPAALGGPAFAAAERVLTGGGAAPGGTAGLWNVG